MHTFAVGIGTEASRAGRVRRGPTPSLLKRWFWLLFGFGCIWAFMFVVVPSFDTLPFVEPLIEFIEERDMNATALFYSDAEETAEAQNYLINSKRFKPRTLKGT